MSLGDVDFKRINYLAVVLAAISAMVIGAIWYNPGVFGTQWMALAGFTAPPEGSMTQAYALGFVNALVKAVVLGRIRRDGPGGRHHLRRAARRPLLDRRHL